MQYEYRKASPRITIDTCTQKIRGIKKKLRITNFLFSAHTKTYHYTCVDCDVDGGSKKYIVSCCINCAVLLRCTLDTTMIATEQAIKVVY